MTRLSRTILYLTLSMLLISCSKSINPTKTQLPAPTVVSSPTVVPTSTVKPTATIVPYPTIIPTIDPTEISNLLQSALSVQTLDILNGHKLRRVSGWNNGFENEYWKSDGYKGYEWLDANHLLLFPIVGETQSPNWTTINARAVVLDIDTTKVWLPPSDLPDPEFRVLRFLLPRWSPESEVLITAENIGEGNTVKESVATYKSDGTFVARYEGRLIAVSPSGNKILIADDTWIDLSSGKKVKFKWDGGTYTPRWRPVWSLDENQIYFCCYYYGNAKTGESYAFSEENSIFEGKPISQDESLHHSHGVWLNDTYVLAQADGFYTGFVNFTTFDSNFIPIFDPSARTFLNLGEKANLPKGYNIEYTMLSISPKRDYMWITPQLKSESNLIGYLVDLKTFQSQVYPDEFAWSWSANGKYATLGLKVLSLSTKELKALPANEHCGAWHPTESICSTVFMDEQKKQTLILQNVQNMSVQRIDLPASPTFRGTIWSPIGDHIALIAEDGSLWQIDYPNLENLEQLTSPRPDIRNGSLIWSPDGRHLSFFVGMDIYTTDIYIVDTNNNP